MSIMNLAMEERRGRNRERESVLYNDVSSCKEWAYMAYVEAE
jgi:hypothetical protein